MQSLPEHKRRGDAADALFREIQPKIADVQPTPLVGDTAVTGRGRDPTAAALLRIDRGNDGKTPPRSGQENRGGAR